MASCPCWPDAPAFWCSALNKGGRTGDVRQHGARLPRTEMRCRQQCAVRWHACSNRGSLKHQQTDAAQHDGPRTSLVLDTLVRVGLAKSFADRSRPRISELLKE